MSLCSYGYQLSYLKSKYIVHSLEYTHLELAAVGVIPVFRKEYGDSCIHRYYKKPLTQVESGTIWLSEDNMNESLNLIKELLRFHQDIQNIIVNCQNHFVYHYCQF